MDQNRFDAALSSRPLPPDSFAWHRQEYWPMVEYAGFWRRYLAVVIDGIVMSIGTKILDAIVVSILERFVQPLETWFGFSVWLLALVVCYMVVDWLYNAGLESSAWQATLGKRVLGVVVTDVAGNRVSFGRATGRYFARYLSMITFLIGYLIQPFTERRQTLHDVIAGTVVVRKGFGVLGTLLIPTPRDELHRRGGMPGWAKRLIAGAIVVSAGCASLGYFSYVLLPHGACGCVNPFASLTDQVAETVTASVSLRIDSGSPTAGRVVLREADLDVNNGVGAPGEMGWTSGSDGTVLYGFETGIDRAGITLGTDGNVMFQFVPVVANGRVELTTFVKSNSQAFLFPRETFGQGFEDGINQALAAKGLRPTAIALGDGSLIILVAPVDSSEIGRGAETRVSAIDWVTRPGRVPGVHRG